jgi:hypothetical protein
MIFFGSETKASKNPTISLIRTFLPRKSSKNLEAALEQFREIAADLSIDESTKENLDGR